MNKPTHSAYLVAHISTSVSPPQVYHVGIYSEHPRTLTGGISHSTYTALLHEYLRDSYDEAKKAAIDNIYHPGNKHLHWVHRWVGRTS